jgi:hypothetical protein
MRNGSAFFLKKFKVIGNFDCQLTLTGARHSSIPAEGQNAGSAWIVGNSEIIPPIDDPNLASKCTKNGVFGNYVFPNRAAG